MIAQNIRNLIRIINRHFSRESYAFDSSLLADLLETAFLASTITDEGRNVSWSIWAIIDQEHLIRGFRQHKGNKFYPRAGRFQVEVDSPGCIALYHNSVMLARLQRDSLTKDFQDVFHEGP